MLPKTETRAIPWIQQAVQTCGSGIFRDSSERISAVVEKDSLPPVGQKPFLPYTA
jgi:hypothetical protein